MSNCSVSKVRENVHKVSLPRAIFLTFVIPAIIVLSSCDSNELADPNRPPLVDSSGVEQIPPIDSRIAFVRYFGPTPATADSSWLMIAELDSPFQASRLATATQIFRPRFNPAKTRIVFSDVRNFWRPFVSDIDSGPVYELPGTRNTQVDSRTISWTSDQSFTASHTFAATASTFTYEFESEIKETVSTSYFTTGSDLVDGQQIVSRDPFGSQFRSLDPTTRIMRLPSWADTLDAWGNEISRFVSQSEWTSEIAGVARPSAVNGPLQVFVVGAEEVNLRWFPLPGGHNATSPVWVGQDSLLVVGTTDPSLDGGTTIYLLDVDLGTFSVWLDSSVMPGTDFIGFPDY